MESTTWNLILTAMMAGLGFLLKNKSDDINKLQEALTRTREQVARDHVTRSEMKGDIEKLRDGMESSMLRLEQKIERLTEILAQRGGCYEKNPK